jgi:hypothetical protein
MITNQARDMSVFMKDFMGQMNKQHLDTLEVLRAKAATMHSSALWLLSVTLFICKFLPKIF